MSDDKKKERPTYEGEKTELPMPEHSVSMTCECTGMIPAAPVSESEMDSYEAIYEMIPDVAHLKEPED